MLASSRIAAWMSVALAWAVLASPRVTLAQTSQPTRPRVLIISIDGCRPDCLLRADMPTIRDLMSHGSFTMWATTTDVAITLPSHVSMLSGVTPERHGIDFNTDPPPDAQIKVPTLFDLAKRAGYSTAIASSKSKFSLFNRTHAIDWPWITDKTALRDDRAMVDHAVDLIAAHRPDVMFVHFASADVSGHGIGWGTPDQIEKLGAIDGGIARVLAAYRDAGLLAGAFVIVSSDHGGTVRTHGEGDERSRFIPWICVGPGVRENYDLTRLGQRYEVRTYDTFATACHVLNLPVPSDSDGKPILPIFTNYDLMLAADAPSTVPDPATSYMIHDTTATSRPVWRGAGKSPTTVPTAGD